MNKMRYPKSNAKDDAEHSHPTDISSAAVYANVQTSSLLPTEHRKLKTIADVFVVVANRPSKA